MVFALIVGLILALVLSPIDYLQKDTVRIMYVHVPSSWISLFIFLIIGTSSFISLIFKLRVFSVYAKSLAPIGLVFSLISVVTGSLWGYPTWGTFWSWDGRLTSMFVLVLTYILYVSLWSFIKNYNSAEKITNIVGIVGLINIPIIKFSVAWWNTLHQPASITLTAAPTIHSSMLAPLLIMAVLSIGIGNVIAIAQTNIKRMYAYSTISHIGFILFGFMSGTLNGYASSLFYVVSYMFMTLVSFAVLMMMSRKNFECETLEDFKGLNKRNPWYAFLMLITMLSMAGIPPTIGFYAKFMVLQAAFDAGFASFVVYAVMMALVGMFYYMRIVKLMYFDEPQLKNKLDVSIDMQWILSGNALALLIIGLMPHSFMDATAQAIALSLH